ncbi:MAG: hypothetical protein CVV05_00275 [Gammaproteobacteria bacterium HGW-Gammaproteobacteria-1]|jgi:hypothetical protein|nr:MAG: hypothetical protein CVV05_00275 [Gammaproteobacteria bacterium HGW-Gammaproteobacteria-1]
MEFTTRNGVVITFDPFDQTQIDAAKAQAPGEGIGPAIAAELIESIRKGTVTNALQLPVEYMHLSTLLRLRDHKEAYKETVEEFLANVNHRVIPLMYQCCVNKDSQWKPLSAFLGTDYDAAVRGRWQPTEDWSNGAEIAEAVGMKQFGEYTFTVHSYGEGYEVKEVLVSLKHPVTGEERTWLVDTFANIVVEARVASQWDEVTCANLGAGISVLASQIGTEVRDEAVKRVLDETTAPGRMQASLNHINEQSKYLLDDHGYTETERFTGRKCLIGGEEYMVIRAFTIPTEFVGDPDIAAKLFAVSVQGRLAQGWGYRNHQVKLALASPPKPGFGLGM